MALTTAQPVPTRQAPPTRAARAALLASTTLTLMAAAIIAPGLPAMGEEFAETPGGGLLVRFVVTITSLGVAVGGIMTAVSSTITDWFEEARQASFLGLQQAFASLGAVNFLPLGGILAGVDWRAPFWLYAVSAAVAVLAFTALPRTVPLATGPPTPHRRGRTRGHVHVGGRGDGGRGAPGRARDRPSPHTRVPAAGPTTHRPRPSQK
ncbi:MFS transporter [Streptomyces sp. RK75]|uniref:MFS transporter n=1 Tax=Streptomyces sp. RK75 TaxID=2824895 RepID=UPI001FFC70EA|nr:MFS transporter [Streptomyces sp. RK75]